MSRRRRTVALIATVLAASGLTVAIQTVPTAGAAPACPWMNPGQTPASRASQLLAAMSIDDKISMVTGVGGFAGLPTSPGGGATANTGPAGTIVAIPALCVPALELADAGAGIGDQEQQTTAYPDAIAQAATFDRTAQEDFGHAVGQEAFMKGVNVWLAPGVDIERSPLVGRGFEYVGEDPYLAGQTAAAVIDGVQSEHVIAQVKHYALNSQETNRMTNSEDATERTMQEIYLPPFETAVKQGHVGSVMCSYNQVNSVYACGNNYLLNTVLKQQFGFQGFVGTDFPAAHATTDANNGLDMEMPGGTYFGAALKTAVLAGQVPMSRLDDMVHRIILMMFTYGLFDFVPAEGAAAQAANAETPDHLAVARAVDEQGAVLLKNQTSLLPLTTKGQKIALIGPAADQAGAVLAYQGGGSGHNPEFGYKADIVSPLQSITTRAASDTDTVIYNQGANPQAAAAVAAQADVAVVVVNNIATEGQDLPDLDLHHGTCDLLTGCHTDPIDQNALISAVAAANPHTIVVLQTGDPVNMPWLSSVPSVLETWFPGQEDGNAMAALLFGDANPSGKLPVTFPKQLSDGPIKTAAQYPGVNLHSTYCESLLVGYRWYDAKNVTPLFPFGYGLSYTTFKYSGLTVKTSGSGAVATFSITNTGQRPGSEVAQLYVGQPASAGEPPKALNGFQKVALNPGQTKQVTIPVDVRAFQHWNTTSHSWTTAAGKYSIMVGGSSRSLPLTASITKTGDAGEKAESCNATS